MVGYRRGVLAETVTDVVTSYLVDDIDWPPLNWR
jgi:hypothetical protein